jgi:hypothetical protein
MGPVLNTIIGAGLKLFCNLLNNWLEHRRQNQLMLAARDNEMLQALLKNQAEQASDPFVKVTRRILFMSLTFTLCFLMIYYALNPDISYSVLYPLKEGTGGFFSWFFGGSKEFEVIELTGGLLLMHFFDLCFMVVGFYAVPSGKSR